jgi:putative SOS response-associated peptidase YedK
MCRRFDTSGLFWSDIYDQLSDFLMVSTAPLDLEPSADVRPATRQLTARIKDGAWTLEKMRWGLVPNWRSGKPLMDTSKGAGDGFKLTTFNCKVENFDTGGDKRSATFAEAFKRRRCIVPATAWFEWTGAARAKKKHRFARADGAPIWFAGLYDRCTTSDAGEVASFTIMTGPSDGWLGEYHTRAPVILEPGREWAEWLDPTRDADRLLKAVRPDRFKPSAA